MGECLILKAGGGGLDTDELTATAADVLVGKIAGVKGSDEPVTGALALTGNFGDGDLLVGRTGYSNDPKNKRNGMMPNRGSSYHAVNSGVNSAGLFFHIEPGFYSEGGNNPWVWRSHAEAAAAIGLSGGLLRAGANVLGIQGDAWTVWTGDVAIDPSKVLAGCTYWAHGGKHTGNLSVQSAINFRAAQYSNLTMLCSWALPSKGPWSGLRVICKQGGYPGNWDDGTLFYEGSDSSATKQLSAGTWYFRAWNYINTNHGRIYGHWHDAVATSTEIKGIQTFTSSGIFTVPNAVRQIQIFVVGAGGGTRQSSDTSGGGGGGYTNTGTFTVSPGQQYQVVIGAGVVGETGQSTYVNGLISISGGNRCGWGSGGSGGSGGGTSGTGNTSARMPGYGGSDGSNGYNRGQTTSPSGAAGQGRTTRAFGEAGNTLYAGGGGGGNTDKYAVAGGGAGGGGVGAGEYYNPPNNGAYGTGGGGGGCRYRSDDDSLSQSTAGGSGICIIRWGY